MFCIGGDVGIMVVVRMVTTVLRVAVVIRKDLFICILGGGICGVGRGGGGVKNGFIGSCLAHHHHQNHHLQNHHHHHHHPHHTAYT